MYSLPPFIKSAYIMLTEACPLRCKYCYIKNKHIDNPISLTTIEKTIKLFPEPPQIIFFGGEPLLKIDLIKETIKNFPECKWQVVSNGIVNFNKFMDEVYYPNRDRFDIQLSWDGNTNSRITLNGNNVNNEVYENLIRNLDKGYSIQTRSVVSDSNIDTLYETYVKLIKLKNKYIHYTPDFNFAHQQSFNNDFFNKLKKQLTLIFEYIFNNIDNYIPQWISLMLFQNLSINGINESCDAGSYICVRPNGDVYPCTILSQISKDFCLGNINDKELNFEILNDLVQYSKCTKDCKLKKYCDGGCRYERIINNIDWKNNICNHTCEIKQITDECINNFIKKLSYEQKLKIVDKSVKYFQWMSEYNRDPIEARKLNYANTKTSS